VIEIRGMRAVHLNREFAMARLQAAVEERLAQVQARAKTQPRAWRVALAFALRLVASAVEKP
jgi:hypothetical protein